MPEWISVKDRLPEGGTQDDPIEVLSAVENKNGNRMVILGFFTGSEWIVYGGDVTHWMPLPEPPKEDAE